MRSKREEVGESPQFVADDVNTIDSILLWADAKVEWDNGTLVDGEGNERVDPRFAGWGLVWRFGFMFLHSDPSNNALSCVKARQIAALFIYLWTRNIEVSVAMRCAENYPF